MWFKRDALHQVFPCKGYKKDIARRVVTVESFDNQMKKEKKAHVPMRCIWMTVEVKDVASLQENVKTYVAEGTCT